MANIIQHKRSSTPGAVPLATGLSQGELGINIGDGKLYTKNSSNTIINLGVSSISGTSITPSSGNFSSSLKVNGVEVSVSGHNHDRVTSAGSLTTAVFNKTGSTIPKFSVVYINGGQGDQPTINLAIASNEAGSSKTYGVTSETISHMGTGIVVVAGALTGVNTDQFNPTAPVGDVNGSALWLSPSVSGSVILTKPTAPNHMVYVGTIVRTHQNEGVVEVRVQNGFELEELHNVATLGATNGQFLQYNSASGLWFSSSSGNFTSLNLNSTGVVASTGGTSNYVSKFTGSNTIGNSLIYDNGTNVGVGTLTPQSKFHITDTNNLNTTLEYTNSTAGFASGVRPLKLLLTGSNGVAVGAGVGIDFVTKSSSTEYTGARIVSNRTDTSNNHALTFWAGGGTTALSEYMRISSDGKVGVGTTTPQTPLEVSFNSNTDTGLRITNTNTSGTLARSSITLYNNGYYAGFTLGGQGYTNDNWLRQNRAALYSPFIMDYVTGQHVFWIGGGGTSTAASGSTQVILIDSNAMQMVNGYPIAGGSAASSYLSLKSTTGAGTSDSIRFLVGNNGGTEAMRITTSGNVGIGTTATSVGATSYKLLVDGDVSIGSGNANRSLTIHGNHASAKRTILKNVNGDSFLSFAIGNQNLSFGETGGLRFNNIYYYAGASTAGLHRFFVSNDNTPEVVIGSGSLGINTTSPTSQLHVIGSGLFSGDVTANGSFIGGSGSAALPSFEFINDPDTGLFSPAANAFSISTSGVERLRIDNVGKVGIGITNPTTTLQVNGSFSCGADGDPSVGGQGLYVDPSVPSLTFNDTSGPNTTLTINNDGLTLYDFIGSPFLYTDRANARIGIGTATPSAALEVVGDIFANNILSSDSFIGGSGTAALPSFEFINDPDTGLFSPASDTLSISTSGVERLRINNIGAVVQTNGYFNTLDDRKSTTYLLSTETTNTIYSSELSSNGNKAIKLDVNKTYTFSILVTARECSSAGLIGGFKLEGIVTDQNGLSTIVGTPVKTVFAKDNINWDINASITSVGADNYLTFTAYSQTLTGHTTRWVANLLVVEVGTNGTGY